MNALDVNAVRNLVAVWSVWNAGGSVLDQLGMDETVRWFRSHGPFLASTHLWSDNGGITVTFDSFGAPDTIPVLYRGATPEGRDGMSWTDSVSFALHYAWDAGGQVFVCDFEPSDFLARVRITYENDPGRTNYEWIMRPNGRTTLWVPPWLDVPTPEEVVADHERMKREFETLMGEDGDVPARMRPPAAPSLITPNHPAGGLPVITRAHALTKP